ncbi:Hypothetical protein SRAE_0000020700 [Strongyloides ratti]|uniref:Uncharacterized protein n=1 Tax=Strongyloides ratti TaxID=34506 RepID=A0A090KYV9_STRRB|nr:Hypothetical protein SRAE_0000020700 [Strongyloides ratti]CEF61077.1 Hypothetical protein SRAE_0000020700 [Strongyloides ratti]
MVSKVFFITTIFINTIIISSNCNFSIDSNESNEIYGVSPKFNFEINKYEVKTTTLPTPSILLKEIYKTINNEEKNINEIMSNLNEAIFLTNYEDIKNNILLLQNEVEKYKNELNEKTKKYK